MSERALPEDVLELIRNCVPSMDALEILIFFCRHREQAWSITELIDAIRPTIVSDGPARDVVAHLVACGIVGETAGRFAYRPRGTTAKACEGLLVAYNERPVTLIRTLYEIADSKKIQAFADAFRLRKDP